MTNKYSSKADDWMVYWKIKLGVSNNEITLRKELSLWKNVHNPTTPQNIPERLDTRVINLDFSTHGNIDIDKKSEAVIFNNGFLECRNSSLRQSVEDLTGGIYQLDQTGISINRMGENVNVWAEVHLESSIERVHYPILYFPQTHNHYVALSEEVDQDGRIMDWRIADPYSQRAGQSNYFKVDNSWHKLHIRQDQDDADHQRNYYEYLVDGVLLNRNYIGEINRANIIFSPEPVTFYIGYNPEIDAALTGKIRYVEFDPNDSCWSC